MEILPPYSQIPEEYKDYGNKWSKFVSGWFFNGLGKDCMPRAKDGVDASLAILNIQACLADWQPKHEHKIAGAAYLASQWFEQQPKPLSR